MIWYIAAEAPPHQDRPWVPVLDLMIVEVDTDDPALAFATALLTKKNYSKEQIKKYAKNVKITKWNDPNAPELEVPPSSGDVYFFTAGRLLGGISTTREGALYSYLAFVNMARRGGQMGDFDSVQKTWDVIDVPKRPLALPDPKKKLPPPPREQIPMAGEEDEETEEELFQVTQQRDVEFTPMEVGDEEEFHGVDYDPTAYQDILQDPGTRPALDVPHEQPFDMGIQHTPEYDYETLSAKDFQDLLGPERKARYELPPGEDDDEGLTGVGAKKPPRPRRPAGGRRGRRESIIRDVIKSVMAEMVSNKKTEKK